VDTYKRNISIQYIFIVICNLDLTRGLWMIYLASRGFSLLQLGILEGVFHITSFLMEVPTGAVADIWGRKISRLAGRVLYLSSLLFMFYAQSFAFQLMGFAACALGYNLESGAGDALVYDSLLLDGKKEAYMGVAGKKELIYQGAMIISLIVGGYLAVRSYSLIFAISIALSVGSMVTALFFIEPKAVKAEENGEAVPTPPEKLHSRIVSSIWDQLVSSLAVVRKRPRIAFLIIFSEILFTFITSLFFYLQNFWKGSGKDEFYVGTALAVSSLVSGAAGWKAAAVEKRIGERGVLTIMPVLLLACIWGIALTPWRAFFYSLTGVVEGILIVAISDYINRLIPSENRATILSFQSMTFSFFMIILFPVIGWVGDAWSLETAFLGMAGFASILCIIYLISFKRLVTGQALSQ
jgi:MFS family permease